MTPKSTKYFRYYTYIEPIIKNPLIKTYGYAIFTMVMTAIFILFAIKPTLETIVVLQKKLTTQKETLKKIDKKISDLGTAQTNYKNINPDSKSKVILSVPANADLANLIRNLESTTLGTTASISALQFQPLVINRKEEFSNKLQEISFTFNIEGSYDTLKSVLQNLYGSTRLFTVESLSFNKVATGNILLMNITGKAYFIK
mgnify:FL=1